MLHVTTPKDLTTALVKMDLKATGETAQVSLQCGVHGLFWPFCKGSSETKYRFSDWILKCQKNGRDNSYQGLMYIFENECQQNAACNNTKGSYNCTCKGGFKGDGRINCTGKILLKSIANHQDQNGISLSSKGELPANFSEIVSQYKKVSNLFVFVFIPTEAISVLILAYKL